MEEKEEVRHEPIGYCYCGKNCEGRKCSTSKVTQKLCKDTSTLDGKSWKNEETGDCINL